MIDDKIIKLMIDDKNIKLMISKIFLEFIIDDKIYKNYDL
jgi:hypothetical protein